MVDVVLFVLVIAGSFVAGTLYGRDAEAKAIAFALLEKAKFFNEYRSVVENVDTRFHDAFVRVKKYL